MGIEGIGYWNNHFEYQRVKMELAVHGKVLGYFPSDNTLFIPTIGGSLPFKLS